MALTPGRSFSFMRSRSSPRKTIAALDRDCAAKTCQHIELECRNWNVRATASALGPGRVETFFCTQPGAMDLDATV